MVEIGHDIFKILDDDRAIDSVVFPDDTSIKVGLDNIEKIEAYGEPSHYGNIPWVAVTRAGEIQMRIPAIHVTIIYEANLSGT